MFSSNVQSFFKHILYTCVGHSVKSKITTIGTTTTTRSCLGPQPESLSCFNRSTLAGVSWLTNVQLSCSGLVYYFTRNTIDLQWRQSNKNCESFIINYYRWALRYRCNYLQLIFMRTTKYEYTASILLILIQEKHPIFMYD